MNFNKKPEIRQEIKDFSVLMNRAVMLIYQGKLYEENWSEEFSWKETKKYLNQVEKETLKIKLNSLSKEEMDYLGFPKFDKDKYCVPVHFHKAAVEQGLMKADSDTDNRFGGMWCFLETK